MNKDELDAIIEATLLFFPGCSIRIVYPEDVPDYDESTIVQAFEYLSEHLPDPALAKVYDVVYDFWTEAAKARGLSDEF